MTEHFAKWLKAYVGAVSVPLGIVAIWGLSHFLGPIPDDVALAIKTIITGLGVAVAPNNNI